MNPSPVRIRSPVEKRAGPGPIYSGGPVFQLRMSSGVGYVTSAFDVSVIL